MRFYNFKHDIISSRFSEGNITKDNLCILFGIEGVQAVHTGENDCLLEWKLFEKLNGRRLLITRNRVFEFNEDYIIPASYLSYYPNLKYHVKDFPKLNVDTEFIKEFVVIGKNKMYISNMQFLFPDCFYISKRAYNIKESNNGKSFNFNARRIFK